jgi:hypothetical protein
MIMQILQISNAPDEAAKAAVEKKSLPMNYGGGISPFTFSRLVQFAGTDSFNSLTPPVSFKNHAGKLGK